eukprot:1286766-Pyramimonas_sp.AAC.1
MRARDCPGLGHGPRARERVQRRHAHCRRPIQLPGYPGHPAKSVDLRSAPTLGLVESSRNTRGMWNRYRCTASQPEGHMRSSPRK